ncbi:MAG: manganese efflux pump [Bacteroidales bacterium]|nr:manganese efflux pump [Bacteroidales bacterium]
MGLLELSLLALALSGDTLIASAMCGLLNPRIARWQVVRISSVMALFQGLMPALGGAVVMLFKGRVAPFGPWMASGLLAMVGGKILLDSLKPGQRPQFDLLKIKTLLTIALATSIDAFSVGMGMELIGANLLAGILVIGGVTLGASCVGLVLGGRLEQRLGPQAGVLAGVVLIGIAIKVLLQHLL